jgi:hypothetical protein
MTNSILSAMSSLLTPEVVGKLGSACGLNPSTAQTALGAAVPSILSGLAGVVGRAGGAQQLANAVAAQPTDILSRIAGGLTGSAQADKGTNLLSSLLGGDAFGLLASTISRFVGISQGSTQSLMGLLTPMIMGLFGREQRAAGLDVNGLARLLTGQKEEITAAMPSGLRRLLEESGVHDAIASSSSPERRTYDSPRTAYGAPQTSTPGMNWLYWVLPLIALGALLWYLLPSGRETVGPVATSQSASDPTPGMQTKSVYLARAPDNWVSIGGTPNGYVNRDIYSRNGEQLGTIKDVLVGSDGKMAAAIINVGRYLGIGDKEIAVPISALQPQQQQNGGQRIVIDATKDALQAAPIFVRRQSPKQ